MSIVALTFQTAYLDPESGEMRNFRHDLNSEDSKNHFDRLLRWACHKGVELRLRPLKPISPQFDDAYTNGFVEHHHI